MSGFKELKLKEGDISNLLAVERTLLAAERTHLAWVRTVITLIASGFAIDKLVETFHQQRLKAQIAIVAQAHFTGLILAMTGMFLLVVEAIVYIKRYREIISCLPGSKNRGWLYGFLFSFVIFLVGLMLIYLILTDSPDELI